MPRRYPIPSPSRRLVLGAIQAGLFAAGVFALLEFLRGRCGVEGTPGDWSALGILWAGFLPLTGAAALRGPGGPSRALKRGAFGLFFLSLLALGLVPPACGASPLVPALWIALAGWVLAAVFLLLGRGPGYRRGPLS